MHNVLLVGLPVFKGLTKKQKEMHINHLACKRHYMSLPHSWQGTVLMWHLRTDLFPLRHHMVLGSSYYVEERIPLPAIAPCTAIW